MNAPIWLSLLLMAAPLFADVLISDCDDPGKWEGPATRDAEHVKQGAASIRWEYGKAGVIMLKDVPGDWTSGNALAFWVYSPKPLVHRPWLVVKGKGAENRWAIAVLRIDFTGWHRFVIPFPEFALRSGTEMPDWREMESISFNSTHPGWLDGPASPDTVVCIDDIRLITVDHPAIGAGPRMTDEEFFAALDLDRPELAEVKAAVEGKDFASAKHAFAAHMRKRRTPRWFDMWWERPQPDPKYKNYWADRIMAGEIKMGEVTYKPEGRIDWSYNPPVYCDGPKKTVEYNAALNRFYHIKHLHEAHWSTSDDKYARKIVRHIVSWIEDCPVLLHQNGNSPYHYAWETLNTAARVIHYWLDSFFRTLDHPAWTDDAIVKVAKSMYEHAQHLSRCYSARGNWRTSEARGMYCIGVLFPEFKLAPEWRRKGLDLLREQLDTEVYPDGLQFELAVGYNMGVLRNFECVLDLAQLNGVIDDVPQDFRDRMQKMYNYLVYVMMPDGNVPGRNDAGNTSAIERYQQAAKFFPARADFRWAATKGAEGKEPPPASVAFPYCGHYVMRTGWDPMALYLILDAGPFGAAHQHEDKLGFTVHAYGKPLVIEAGTHMYDVSPERKYVLSTRGHNTVRVDGLDQRSWHVREAWVLAYPFQPSDNPWVAGADLDFVEGRYEHGYGTRESRKVEAAATHTRSILFVKPSYWIVTDTMVAGDDKEHRCESLFHLGAEDAVAKGLAVSTQNKEANLHILAAPMDGLSVEIVKGREKPDLQGWTQRNFTNLKPTPTAVYQWPLRGRSRVCYVFYPTPAGAECPIKEIKPLTVTDDKGGPAQAAAMEVCFRDGSRHAYCYADPGVGRIRFDRFAVDGRCALIKLNPAGEITAACQAFGTTMLCDDKPLAIWRPIEEKK